MNETRKQGYIRTETVPSQARIEAAAKAVEEAYKCYGTEFTTIAICALTAAAEVGNDDDPFAAGLLKLERAATIERCAQYHDNAARECDLIAEANKDNKLGADCRIRALDHREDAAAIRALKDKP